MKAFLRRKPSLLHIDITPLIDVVFQLLLFFILTSVLVQPSLPLDLPDSKQKHEQADTDMVISVDSNGLIFLNDDPVSLEDLEPVLLALKAAIPEPLVTLRGDRQVRYGIFFDILDIARKAGIKTLYLAYEEQEP